MREEFRKSSFSGMDCVEVGVLGDGSVAVRNSRDRSDALQIFTPHEWRAFVRGVENGEFNFVS